MKWHGTEECVCVCAGKRKRKKLIASKWLWIEIVLKLHFKLMASARRYVHIVALIFSSLALHALSHAWTLICTEPNVNWNKNIYFIMWRIRFLFFYSSVHFNLRVKFYLRWCRSHFAPYFREGNVFFFRCSFILFFFKLPPISIIDISIGFGADFHAGDVLFSPSKNRLKWTNGRRERKKRSVRVILLFFICHRVLCVGGDANNSPAQIDLLSLEMKRMPLQ